MKRALVITCIAAFAFACLVALELYRPFAYERARYLVRDAIARAGRTTPPNPDLVFLAIDSDSANLQASLDVDELFQVDDSNSVEARALQLMTEGWPWPREVYALIIERLVEAGAKVVLFDMMFPQPTDGDEPFRLALDKHKDRVVIGSNFPGEKSKEQAPTHARPSESLVPHTTPMDDRVAYTNFWGDSDEVVRRARYGVTLNDLHDHTPIADAERFLSLAARGLTKAGYGNVVPQDVANRLFRYTAPPRQGFRPRSLFEIFVPRYWEGNYQRGEFFRGKIVLVGAEGNWAQDEHPTPFGSMPGPEIHLNAMNAALHGEFIREMSPRAIVLVALLAGLMAIAVTLAIRSPWLRLLVLIALDVGFIYAVLQAFNHLNLYVPALAGLTELNLTVLLGLIFDFTRERVEKTRVRRTLERYVSTNVVREMLDRPQAFEQSLGGVVRPVAILFSDIRGYTSVSAKTDPHALVEQLNEYLTAMVECVFRYGGTLDKFIGDAVMAVWGNVQTAGVRNDAANAVRAALAMREELARLNVQWRKRGLQELRVGIAINQGDVIVGNVGSARRMEFTVIGDVVNVSWRLQELTKQLGSDLLVSKSVSALVLEEFELRAHGKSAIAGYAEEVEVFSVLGPVSISLEPSRPELTPA